MVAEDGELCSFVFLFVWANTALEAAIGGILFAVGGDICWMDEEDGVYQFDSSSLSLG